MKKREEVFFGKLPEGKVENSTILVRISTILIQKKGGINVHLSEDEILIFKSSMSGDFWRKVFDTMEAFTKKNADKSRLLKLSYTEDNSINLEWVSPAEFIGDEPMEINDEFLNFLKVELLNII